MNYSLIFTVGLFLIAVWYAWRYYKLRRDINQYASRARVRDTSTNITELENLSRALSSKIAACDLQHSDLESERARLATVLEQITDGVLIADNQGLVQFANPAAGRLFQTSSPINRSITEVVRRSAGTAGGAQGLQ